MMTRTIVALLLASASAAAAQGRGGRQGGPASQGPECLNREAIDHIRILKGAGAIATYGPDATNGIVIISPRAGGGDVFGPCSTTTPIDAFNTNLFAPSWVMSLQQQIGLSGDQKAFIQNQMVLAQNQFTLSESKLRSEMETLNGLLAAKPVDEREVLFSVDRVLAYEREIKRAQVSLMVNVKNKLTEQQQAQLEKLRRGDDD